MTVGRGTAYTISVVAIIGFLVAGIWIASLRGPIARDKKVEVRITTRAATCWIVGTGERRDDGTIEGRGSCGPKLTEISNEAVLPPSSIVVTKTSDDDAPLHAEFIVDGEVTDSGTTTTRMGSLYLSGT